MDTLSPALLSRLDCGILVFDSEQRLYYANQWIRERACRNLTTGQKLTEMWPDINPQSRLCSSLAESIELGLSAILSPGLHNRQLPLGAAGATEPDPAAQQTIIIRPLREGPEPRALVQIYDVTSMMQRESLLRRRERELAAANEKTRRASEVKSRFMADMSHELRTPMNAVLGFADALKQGLFDPLSNRQAEAVEHISAAGEHLLALLNELLDLAKIEAGRWEFEIAPLDLLNLTDSVTRMLAPLAAQKTVMLTVRSELKRPLWLGCERSLRQILINLIGNALKYTPDFGRVAVLLEDGVSGPMIQITDTGIGMTQQQLKQLGQSFTQLSEDPALRNNGVGLGLSICYALLEEMKGSLSYTSTPGVGTTVTINLPPVLNRAEPVASA